MQFESLNSLAGFLERVTMDRAIEHALEHIGEAVEATAKAEFGVYQPATGGFPEWPELADSTKAQRVALGFTENEPLLRTGALRDSVSHDVRAEYGEVVIGSPNPVMAYQELGTSRIPPRPVLGPAVIHNIELIRKLAARALVLGMLPPGDHAPEQLALYNFTIANTEIGQ